MTMSSLTTNHEMAQAIARLLLQEAKQALALVKAEDALQAQCIHEEFIPVREHFLSPGTSSTTPTTAFEREEAGKLYRLKKADVLKQSEPARQRIYQARREIASAEEALRQVNEEIGAKRAAEVINRSREREIQVGLASPIMLQRTDNTQQATIGLQSRNIMKELREEEMQCGIPPGFQPDQRRMHKAEVDFLRGQIAQLRVQLENAFVEREKYRRQLQVETKAQSGPSVAVSSDSEDADDADELKEAAIFREFIARKGTWPDRESKEFMEARMAAHEKQWEEDRRSRPEAFNISSRQKTPAKEAAVPNDSDAAATAHRKAAAKFLLDHFGSESDPGVDQSQLSRYM